MADIAAEASAPRPAEDAALTQRRPPMLAVGPVAWARANLFSSWISTAVTLALGYLLIRWAMGF
ncbi:amino acid ABC transporter permease, partial [Pseudoroseomonas rhizosphaerae]